MNFWKPEGLRADVSKGYARGHYHGSSRPTQDESSAVSERVQAIIVASDQYAKKALGNREFFLKKPHGIGGGKERSHYLTATEASGRASSQLPGLDDRVMVIE
jgi:hypothetical protein